MLAMSSPRDSQSSFMSHPPDSTAASRAMAMLSDATAAATVRSELKALLDAVPGARRVLPHLAVMEQVLASEGFDGLDALPTDALQRARDQLGKLPLSSKGSLLPQMLLLLELALEARKAALEPAPSQLFLSSFLTDDKLMVSEASATDFAQLMGDPPAPPKR